MPDKPVSSTTHGLRSNTKSITEKYKPQLTVEDIEEILGIEKYDEEIAEKTRYFMQPLSLCSDAVF